MHYIYSEYTLYNTVYILYRIYALVFSSSSSAATYPLDMIASPYNNEGDCGGGWGGGWGGDLLSCNNNG